MLANRDAQLKERKVAHKTATRLGTAEGRRILVLASKKAEKARSTLAHNKGKENLNYSLPSITHDIEMLPQACLFLPLRC